MAFDTAFTLLKGFITKTPEVMMLLRNITTIIFITFFSFLSMAYAQEVNYDWVRSFGDSGNDHGSSLTIDNEGDLIQCGHYSNDPTFLLNGDSITINSTGDKDVFLKKWTTEGELIWVKNYGGIGVDMSSQVVTDNNGGIYMVGSFDDQINFDSTNTDFQLVSKGLTDMFFGKWNAQGDLLWVKQIGGTLDDNGNALTLDNEGNIYLTGYFQGNCDFDPGVGNAILSSDGANYNYKSGRGLRF